MFHTVPVARQSKNKDAKANVWHVQHRGNLDCLPDYPVLHGFQANIYAQNSLLHA